MPPTRVPRGARPVSTQGLPHVSLQETTLLHRTQTLHSESPLYSSEKERRATVQGHGAFWRRRGVCWPRKARAGFLLPPHLSQGGRPPGPQPGSSEIIWTSLSQWPEWPTTYITSMMCVCIYVPVSVCVSKLRLPARQPRHIELGVFYLQN